MPVAPLHPLCPARRPPHVPLLILAVFLLILPSPTQGQTREAAPEEATAADLEALLPVLQHHLDSLAAEGAFSGVVILAREGTPVFQGAWGWADREAGRPNTVDTAFNLGSIDKVFTATAIRQLAELGRIHLDSTLAHHWPDYPQPEFAQRVTVRQLLEHRSGIGGNIFGSPEGGRRADLRTLEDFLGLFVHEPPAFPPGTRQQYSNAGYVVLGLLVERLSGVPYHAYVRRHILEPSGMTRTGPLSPEALPSDAAVGYTRGDPDAPSDAPLRPNTVLLPGQGSSAGGGYATGGDLLRFLEAIRAGRVAGAPPAGLGVAGGAPGLNAALEGSLPGGVDLVVLANLDPPAAERVARRVRRLLGQSESEPFSSSERQRPMSSRSMAAGSSR
jgi:D-alanyl-D-alanine carboxypeptidase